MKQSKPCMLMILDGWGINPSVENNAVAAAKTPNLDTLFTEYPSTRLKCSGEAVGLPAGIMGNSEVGHLNIGAGRIVYQTLLRIDKSIEDKGFFNNDVFLSVMKETKKKQSALHIMGLLSDGGVHSQFSHLLALIDMAVAQGLEKVFIHVILDGRDTPPDSGRGYVKTLVDYLSDKSGVSIATICGRFYAMDRDTRWERTEEAYQLYTENAGISATDPVKAVEEAYSKGETDEFVKPVVLGSGGKVSDNDGIIFYNFRADRARQITRAFTDKAFDGFVRRQTPDLSEFVCMSLYDETFDLPVAFGPTHYSDILGEIVSKKGLRQLRIAETEKYAHVTYFFNGGEESTFPGEDRCMIPSPREAATYDLIPEMSACAVADETVKRIRTGEYDLIVLNFANMDMVGHTGIMDAAVKAVETVDACVGRVVTAIREAGGTVVLTADHGNSEQMVDEKGGAHTAHTLNDVPLLIIDESLKQGSLKEGCLADIAPTLLRIMGIDQPEAMTGNSLIE